MKPNDLINAIGEAEAAAEKTKTAPDKEARRAAFLAKKKELNERFDNSIQQMREGNSELFRGFLNAAARMPQDEIFKNLVLIAAQKPDALLVKPGYVWKKKGYKLPPADKVIHLFVKNGVWIDKEGDTRDNYDPKECYDVADLGVRVAMPALPDTDHNSVISAIYTVLSDPAKYENQVKDSDRRSPVTFAISADQKSDALYDPATSSITVRQGLPPKECCEGIIMEMCHRERYLGGWEKEPRTREDMFIAYSATYVICRKLALPTEDFDFPPVFLEASDNKTFERELRSIVKTANTIGERLDTQLFSMRREAQKGARAETMQESGSPVQGV